MKKVGLFFKNLCRIVTIVLVNWTHTSTAVKPNGRDTANPVL